MIKVPTLITELSKANIEFGCNIDLSNISAIKVSSIADYLIKPRNEHELILTLRILKNCGYPYKIIGRLTNMIIISTPTVTPLISTENLREMRIEGNIIYAESGCSLPSVCSQLTRLGWDGFWGLVTVPGSIGGGVFMNAGAYGHDLSDFLWTVRCIDQNGNLKEFHKSDLNFSWRYSAFKDQLSDFVIVGATFKMVKGDTELLNIKMQNAKAHRKCFLENENPNLGSTLMTRDIYSELGQYFRGFKYVTLIVKGLTFLLPLRLRDKFWAQAMTRLAILYFGINNKGNVGISTKTFNCIINRGGASAEEIADFIKMYCMAIENRIPLEVELFSEGLIKLP